MRGFTVYFMYPSLEEIDNLHITCILCKCYVLTLVLKNFDVFSNNILCTSIENMHCILKKTIVNKDYPHRKTSIVFRSRQYVFTEVQNRLFENTENFTSTVNA